MVEVKSLLEGEYINVEYVRNSPTKKVTILTEGEMRETDYGNKLVLSVEIDGKTKKWTLNKSTMENLKGPWGTDSKNWVGMNVAVMVTKMQGKEMVIGAPAFLPEAEAEAERQNARK